MAEIGQVGGPANVSKISQIGTENDRILPGVVTSVHVKKKVSFSGVFRSTVAAMY